MSNGFQGNNNVKIEGNLGTGSAAGPGASVSAHNIAGGNITVHNYNYGAESKQPDERPRFYIHDLTKRVKDDDMNTLLDLLKEKEIVVIENHGFVCTPATRPQFVVNYIGYAHAAILLVDKEIVEKAPYELTILWWILHTNQHFQLLLICIDGDDSSASLYNQNGGFCVFHEHEDQAFEMHIAFEQGKYQNQIKVLHMQEDNLSLIEEWVCQRINPLKNSLINPQGECKQTYFELREAFVKKAFGGDFDLIAKELEFKLKLFAGQPHHRNQGLVYRIIRDFFQSNLEDLNGKIQNIEDKRIVQRLFNEVLEISKTNKVDVAAATNLHQRFMIVDHTQTIIGVNIQQNEILDLYIDLAYSEKLSQLLDNRYVALIEVNFRNSDLLEGIKEQIFTRIYEVWPKLKDKMLDENDLEQLMGEVANETDRQNGNPKRLGMQAVEPHSNTNRSDPADNEKLLGHVEEAMKNGKFVLAVSTIFDKDDNLPQDIINLMRKVQHLFNIFPFIILSKISVNQDTDDVTYIRPVITRKYAMNIYKDLNEARGLSLNIAA